MTLFRSFHSALEDSVQALISHIFEETATDERRVSHCDGEHVGTEYDISNGGDHLRRVRVSLKPGMPLGLSFIS
jgi:hypothetical protein